MRGWCWRARYVDLAPRRHHRVSRGKGHTEGLGRKSGARPAAGGGPLSVRCSEVSATQSSSLRGQGTALAYPWGSGLNQGPPHPRATKASLSPSSHVPECTCVWP